MLGDAERSAVDHVMRGTILTHGPNCADFENSFADYVGAKHAISTSNCTTAIHLGLTALGVSSADEVIVPAMTHVASAHAVEHCGAVPVFVDVDGVTGCINPDLIERKINKKTKAIIAVHFVGLPCEMDRIRKIAREHNIAIVEDSATALGSVYGDQKAGVLGDLGCFSFYPTKHITSMEGGMLTTNDDKIASAVRSGRAFGYDRGLQERKLPGIYDIADLGWNYRMSEGHAAVGRVQLTKIESFLHKRKSNAEHLYNALAHITELFVHPFQHAKSQSSWYCVNMQVTDRSPKTRNEMIEFLNAQGVGTSVHYPVPLPLSKYYAAKYPNGYDNYPEAKKIAENTISLPCGPHLTPSDVDYVIGVIKSALSAT
jgi:perosamine synthetase